LKSNKRKDKAIIEGKFVFKTFSICIIKVKYRLIATAGARQAMTKSGLFGVNKLRNRGKNRISNFSLKG
jgi:hypothetical protein